MTLRLNPGRTPRRLTPAQQAATDRSFRIFRLRGLYEQCALLTDERREQARIAIDAELERLGAETHTARIAATRSEP
jgi:hypothetical protein